MKTSICVKALYEKYGNRLAKTYIKVGGDYDYYDLRNELNNQLVCCDGETCSYEIVEYDDGVKCVGLVNENDNAMFELTLDEFEVAAGFDPTKHWEGEMSQEKFDKAKQCLIDNGIEADESEVVLQALCYILMNVEAEQFMTE